ncbi:MAG: hypothetical protein H0X37_14960 [Herpetosiphonaceae bacterium]|nr:hypothetical protein [Herpetosiphonaceae bacterium]
MNEQWTAAQAREDWQKARRQAFWSSVVDVLRRRPSELMPLDEVKARLNVRGSNYRGLQHVPLEKIVGSEGRYADFDRRFLPREEKLRSRWQNIDAARYLEVPLPPVDLYKVGDIYFVKDGNHRVSVARQLGQADIDAYVTEYMVDVPLDASLSMRDLIIKEEYSDFLEWTHLAELRPQQCIELSSLGGYLELIQHINTHRYYLGLERSQEVTPEEAVTSWYDHVYMPVIDVIRKGDILNHFPGRTEADLYLWIMSHRNYLREFGGVDPGAEAATLDYVSRYGYRGVRGAVNAATQSLWDAAHAVVGSITPPSLEVLDFIEWSHIDLLCPQTDVRLSDPRDFARLRQHILAHRYYMGQEQQREVPLQEAVEHWCSTLYTPITQALQAQDALEQFPGQTLSDLFLWTTDHIYFRKLEGVVLEPEAAVREFVERYSKEGALAGLIRRARQLVRRKG